MQHLENLFIYKFDSTFDIYFNGWFQSSKYLSFEHKDKNTKLVSPHNRVDIIKCKETYQSQWEATLNEQRTWTHFTEDKIFLLLKQIKM